jgi:hypothetical protein
MPVRDFLHTLDQWITALDRYNMDQLLHKPAVNTWSIGQLYVHLIESTQHCFSNIEKCMEQELLLEGEPTEAARQMFTSNQLPDKKIEGPASNQLTAQPAGKAPLVEALYAIRARAVQWLKGNDMAAAAGKTGHPGLGYFTASQWLQFAEMHLRHHFRQKKEIEQQLKAQQLFV